MKSFCLVIVTLLLGSCAATQPYQSEKTVTSVSFSPDHKLLAYADARQIRVIEYPSGREVSSLVVLPADAQEADRWLYRHGVGDSMVFLDDHRIATTGMGGLISTWDVHSGKRLAVLDPLPGDEFASTIDYSPSTQRLVIGTSAGRVLLTSISANGFDPLVPIASLEGYTWDLQLSRDGRYLASASQVSVKTPAGRSTEETADAFARANIEGTADPAPETSTVEAADSFAQSHNQDIERLSNVGIWDLEQQSLLGVMEGASGVFRLSLVPAERALLTAGDKVQVWEFLSRQQSEELKDPSMALQSIGLGTVAAVSVAGLAMGVVPPVDFVGNSLLSGGFPFIPNSAFMTHACARAAAISPDGQTIVTTTMGPAHNVMSTINRRENKVVEKWTADSYVCDMQFSPDGKRLIAATSRGIFEIDPTNGKKARLEPHR